MRGWNEKENKFDEDFDWDAYTDSDDEDDTAGLIGLMSLPFEVLEIVVSFLPLSDISRFARVAKGCQKVAESKAMWDLLLEKDFGIAAKKDLRLDTSAQDAYHTLLHTEFTADFTVRQIERVGFRDIRVGIGARYEQPKSHWGVYYPSPPNGQPNISCDFDLCLESFMERAPAQGVVLGVIWASEGQCRMHVQVNEEVLARSFAPPRTPENKRLPLTGGGEQCLTEFVVPRDALRLDTSNRVSLRYLPGGGAGRLYVRRITIYPVMNDTIRRETSRRKTITIVRSINC